MLSLDVFDPSCHHPSMIGSYYRETPAVMTSSNSIDSSRREKTFCANCGNAVLGGNFCTACGQRCCVRYYGSWRSLRATFLSHPRGPRFQCTQCTLYVHMYTVHMYLYYVLVLVHTAPPRILSSTRADAAHLLRCDAYAYPRLQPRL